MTFRQVPGTFVSGVLLVCSCLGSPAAYAASNGLALSPPLGWTSWTSFQTNIDEESIKAVARVQSSTLKQSGYVYVNIDAGWFDNFDAVIDPYGRWVADPRKFPSGMAALADYIHGLGLRFGIYVTPGIPALAVIDNTPIEGTPYRALDIAIPDRLQATYVGGTMMYIDYSAPGSQEFINSWANLFASWSVDYVKLDAVGDWNIPDIRAWSAALAQSGRPIHLALSNNLHPDLAATWRQYANGWRISGDIEAYNGVALTTWEHVAERFTLAPRWLGAAASGGWNDLDSLTIGGDHTGLTRDERRTMVTLWALCASPLIVGDDLRDVDTLGISLLTNPEVIAVNQAGVVAAPVSAGTWLQVWAALQADGSYAVGLFNLGETPATVDVSWSGLGFAGPAKVRDLWARSDLGSFDAFSAPLDPHASLLLRVTPAAPVRESLSAAGAVSAWAFIGFSPVSPGGQIARYVGFGSALTYRDVTVTTGGSYRLTVSYVNGDTAPRASVVTVNTSSSWTLFPAGSWTTRQSVTLIVAMAQGTNEITFWNPVGWAPDIVGVTVQPLAPVEPAFTLRNVLTGRVLHDAFGATGAGHPIIQWPDSGDAHQQWLITSHPDGSSSFVNRASGLALDVYGFSTYPGLHVIQWPLTDGPSQRWRAVSAGHGAFVLINLGSGLPARGSSEWEGAKVDQWLPTGTEDQHWILVPVM